MPIHFCLKMRQFCWYVSSGKVDKVRSILVQNTRTLAKILSMFNFTFVFMLSFFTFLTLYQWFNVSVFMCVRNALPAAADTCRLYQCDHIISTSATFDTTLCPTFSETPSNSACSESMGASPEQCRRKKNVCNMFFKCFLQMFCVWLSVYSHECSANVCRPRLRNVFQTF